MQTTFRFLIGFFTRFPIALCCVQRTQQRIKTTKRKRGGERERERESCGVLDELLTEDEQVIRMRPRAANKLFNRYIRK